MIESARGDVAGVKVKAAKSLRRSDANGLKFLRDKLGKRFKCGVVIYSGEHSLRLDDRIWAVPISGLWSDTRA